MSTDVEWERWGAEDPYYGVLTNPKFRASAITLEAKREFFESGRRHVHDVMTTCRTQFDAHFAPNVVLDFGCGVGRIAIPFAEMSPHVVGMDVSPSMLAEATSNSKQLGVANVDFVLSDDQLSAAPGAFDLVHSSIVLQHIEIDRGRTLFAHLVSKVRPGGIGALHVTFGLDCHANTFGQIPPPPPPPPPPTMAQRMRSWLRTTLLPRSQVSPAAAVAPSGDPEMQMNYYNLSELHFLLQRAGVQRVCTELTDHGGALGAFMFFQKPRQ